MTQRTYKFKAAGRRSPIFIVGMARSGTTLLRRLLLSHPNIAIPPETQFLSNWVNLFPGNEFNKPGKFQSFWNDFSKSVFFHETQIDSEIVKEKILNSSPITYKMIFSILLDTYAESCHKPRWGEKTPDHYRYIGILLHWFPDGRVVFLQRDPRAVISSLLAAPWARNSVSEHALDFLQFSHALEKWHKDPRVYTLKYELLVVDPEKEIRQLLIFLDEEFFSSILDPPAKLINDKNLKSWSQDHMKQVLKPISTSNIDKWMTRLTHREIAIIEHINRAKMIRYGYTPITDGLTNQDRFFYLTQLFFFGLHKVCRFFRQPAIILRKQKLLMISQKFKNKSL